MTDKLRVFSIIAFAAAVFLLLPDAQAGSNYGLGIEGFHDNYKEPDPGVDSNANYGSLTGYYSYGGSNGFVSLDGRASYGSNNYSSPSGTIDNVPQWEYELRLRAGPNLAFWDGVFSPYIGLGGRYFVDEGKGTVTNLGYLGYDRRIAQLYLPVGITYSHVTENNWTIAPNIEYDQFLSGNVNSRLQNDGGYNVNNHQNSGYGVRGEFMIGQAYNSYAWQFGPFARYWHINDSKVEPYPGLPPGYGIEEPENTRTQVGVALRFLW